jgi:hypothetical protein
MPRSESLARTVGRGAVRFKSPLRTSWLRELLRGSGVTRVTTVVTPL